MEGIDDASDEFKSVAEAMQKLGTTNEEVVKRAKEVLKEARDEKKVLKAIAEEAKVFGDRVMEMANSLNKLAGFAGKINSLFNSYNTALTAVNTAELKAIEAKKQHAALLESLARKYNIAASSTEELIAKLRQEQESLAELAADLRAGENVQAAREVQARIKEIDNAIKELTKSQQEMAKADQEAAAAKERLNQQMAALALQAVGLIPSAMQMVNEFSKFVALLPTLTAGLNAVKGAFTGLYAALGPIGLALLALSVVIPVIIAHWGQITAALNQAASVIWSVIGPAFEWFWNNILKPLADFLVASFIANWQTLQTIWQGLVAAGNALAAGLQWLWDNILVPLGTFIDTVFIVYIQAWSAAWESIINAVDKVKQGLEWLWNNVLVPLATWLLDVFVEQYLKPFARAWEPVRQSIESALNAIYDIANRVLGGLIKLVDRAISTIKGAFDWLREQLVGHSIIPDMMKDVVAWTEWGLGRMQKLAAEAVETSLNIAVGGPRVIGGISVTVNVTVNAGEVADPERLAEAVSREIARRLRGIVA